MLKWSFRGLAGVHGIHSAVRRRRLPGVGHYVREGVTLAETVTRRGATLPALVGLPVEQHLLHQQHPQVSGRHGVYGESCRRDGRWCKVLVCG
jgi:hypothetical protein